MKYPLRHAIPIIFGGLVAWVLSMYFERPFLSYKNIPFPSHMEQVKAGEVMPFTVHRCSTADVPRFYDITHELRSVDRPETPPITLRSERVRIDPGCHKGTSRINLIPPNTSPGMYYVSGLGIVVGSLRTFTVPWHSEPFEVVK